MHLVFRQVQRPRYWATSRMLDTNTVSRLLKSYRMPKGSRILAVESESNRKADTTFQLSTDSDKSCGFMT